MPEGRAPGGTRIELANLSRLAPDGSGPVVHVDFDAHRLVWTPGALLAALLLATPGFGRARLAMLALGMALFCGALLFFLRYWTWFESASIGLAALNPFWLWVHEGVRQGLRSHFPLACPVVIWLLVASGPLARFFGKV
jgi:hypothetical protein